MSEQDRGSVAKEKRSRDPEKWIHRPIEKYRKGKGALEFRPDAEFFALADEVVQTRRTLLGYDRLYVFWQAIRNLEGVPGNAAEIGSYRGGSAFFVASAFQATLGADVPFDVFDTFEGHPPMPCPIRTRITWSRGCSPRRAMKTSGRTCRRSRRRACTRATFWLRFLFCRRLPIASFTSTRTIEDLERQPRTRGTHEG